MKLLILTLTLLLTSYFSISSAQAQDVSPQGEVIAPSPQFVDPDEPGYFKIGVGPGFPIGLKTDQMLYDLYAGYHHTLGRRVAAKVFTDLNVGASTNSARLFNFGAGFEYYLQNPVSAYGVPYVTADGGYGFIRNADNETNEGAVVGLGAGFKFEIQRMDLDVSARYSVITETLAGETPSILGLQLAAAF